ncbi:NADPH-dependent FMN reductase [Georgenia yuyongxinii]|uniref:NADPH-dependent FMN reductase n=1 Tax=Georgenia yuyongxinii TaxID=2589797 RepID=A0A5B8C5A5_9MICO|nr:FMN reductase [Georgenia yuyongxinii]QDC25528.1 NADPH-dependent FMN reductase [Georgenia yuyongxinii]
MSERTIVTVSAGLGQPSSTRLLADRLSEATVTELEARGVNATVEAVELRDVAHEIVNTMLTGFATGELSGVLEKLTAADGLILVTPLFTTTYSGLFKSFIDIIDKDALTDMPVLLGATGGTPRHSLALEYSMRPLLTYLRADVATTSVFAATDDWAGEGDQVNPLPGRIRRAGRELAEMVAARENAGPADLYDGVPSFDQMLGNV